MMTPASEGVMGKLIIDVKGFLGVGGVAKPDMAVVKEVNSTADAPSSYHAIDQLFLASKASCIPGVSSGAT